MNSKFLKYTDSESLLLDCMKNSTKEQYQDLFHEYANLKLMEPMFGHTSGPAIKIINLDTEKDGNENLFESLGVLEPIMNYKKARGWDSIRCESTAIYDSVQVKLSNENNILKDMSVNVLGDWGDVCNQSKKIRYHIVATTYGNLTKAIEKRGYKFNYIVLGYEYWIPQTELARQQDEQFFKDIKQSIKNKTKLKINVPKKFELDDDQQNYVRYALNDIEADLSINGQSTGGQLACGGFGKTFSDNEIALQTYIKFWDKKIYG